ncbi:hypothetical protein G5714_024606 [Onychostoma macrolepis]|uniref:Uncharacterized protein n=1 Tax=Onychostoma macrolepis TaxID=369639 RepID=A0A7J6BJY7_9TELE|nr:hypothetical protein G5714_024606 [Onychostoma macrolepis]
MSLGLASKSPWSLAVTAREPHSRGAGLSPLSTTGVRGAGVVPTPPGRRVSGPGAEKPLELSCDRTNRTKGRLGSAHPTRETCLWAWRAEKPLSLAVTAREPDQGALGQCPPRQGDVSLGLASPKAPEPAFKRQT